MPAPDDFVYQMRLVADESEQSMLDELALFLFHLDAVYDISRLTVEPDLAKIHPDYPDFWYPPWPRRLYFPDEYPLSRAERLQVQTISKRSPLELISTVAVIAGGTGAAFWAFTQAIEMISNWSLNKEKLRLEVAKARDEAAKVHAEKAKAQSEARQALHDERRILPDNEITEAINKRMQGRALDFHLSQLERLPFKTTLIEVRIIQIKPDRTDKTPEKKNKK